MTLKRTILFPAHQKLGARLVDFGGWEMPVQYSGIVDEHLTVRRAAGVFDISHMGQFLVSGEGAREFLNRALTNDVRRLEVGRGQYTLLCNDRGGVVDDLYLYQVATGGYLLIVNASRINVDFTWLEHRRQLEPAPDGIQLKNLSSERGAVAIQGPAVQDFVHRCFPSESLNVRERLDALRKNQMLLLPADGGEFHIARTGYTGEDGFEVFAPASQLEALWNRVLAEGRSYGLKPCGLGARDTLRTEMGYPLYGHELDEEITPIEAGLGYFVALDKGEFTGRDHLREHKQNGVARKCVAFVMAERSPPPRPGHVILGAEPGGILAPIGLVTSGTQSPCLGRGIGLGYVPPQQGKPGSLISIEIRGRQYAASITAKPIYRPSVERVQAPEAGSSTKAV